MEPDVRAELEALRLRVERLEARLGSPEAIDTAPGWSSRMLGDQLENEVVAILREGHKIDAIKLYREHTDLGLADAKDAVEEIERRRGL